MRFRVILFVVVLTIVLSAHAVIVIPGLLAGKKLIGAPNSGAIYSTGGFHCPGDGPAHIHYHTCQGDPVALPDGRSAADFPDHQAD